MGHAVKIRIEQSLLDRARVCADAVDASLADWAGRVLRRFRAGKLPRVADARKTKVATRAGSVVCTLPGEPSDATDMRAALAAGVAWCEARLPPPFESTLVEGRDYVVEVEAE